MSGASRSKASEIFAAFLTLGLTSFGGPIAHLGYFRREFVHRRNWLTEPDYAAIISLCQFLPGPASSQAGFCIGLRRGGWPGGLAAWAGFTMPSAIAMFLIASGAATIGQSSIGRNLLHGLQLAAIAIVTQAVAAMARSLCPDLPRRALAVLSLFITAIIPNTVGQLLVLIIGALTGRAFLTPPTATTTQPTISIAPRHATACIIAFFTLLAFTLIDHTAGPLGLFSAFYRTGALVFGGGHVVLPLLQGAVVAPGWVTAPNFITGYGAAQAMPGPLFTVAAYLGAIAHAGPRGITGALIALSAIFLPGLLLVAGILPIWHQLQQNNRIAAAITGLNAAVVGLLAYALLTLLTQNTIRTIPDLLIVIAATLALTTFTRPPIQVVAACALAALIF